MKCVEDVQEKWQVLKCWRHWCHKWDFYSSFCQDTFLSCDRGQWILSSLLLLWWRKKIIRKNKRRLKRRGARGQYTLIKALYLCFSFLISLPVSPICPLLSLFLNPYLHICLSAAQYLSSSSSASAIICLSLLCFLLLSSFYSLQTVNLHLSILSSIQSIISSTHLRGHVMERK